MASRRGMDWTWMMRLLPGRTRTRHFETVEVAPEPDARTRRILERLALIEADALAVYAAHGLPTQPGDYIRAPDRAHWVRVGERLSAQERWSLVLEEESTKGWRFRSLEDIGAGQSDLGAEVARASDMLSACRRLRQALTGTHPESRAADIETALELGASWGRLASEAESPPTDVKTGVEAVAARKPRGRPASGKNRTSRTRSKPRNDVG